MNDGIVVAIATVAIIFGIFGTVAVTERNQHECRMEAMKALVDPSKIKEICG
jgi:hypothetical protein